MLVAVALGLTVLAVGGFVTVRGVASRQEVEPDVEGTRASPAASTDQPRAVEPTAARAALEEPAPAPAPSPSASADAGAAGKKRLWRGKKRSKSVDFGF